MVRSNTPKLPTPLSDERDIELENVIGNLLIATYQTDKLRARLLERMGGHGEGKSKKASTHVYKFANRWYKITTIVDEVGVEEVKEGLRAD